MTKPVSGFEPSDNGAVKFTLALGGLYLEVFRQAWSGSMRRSQPENEFTTMKRIIKEAQTLMMLLTFEFHMHEAHPTSELFRYVNHCILFVI